MDITSLLEIRQTIRILYIRYEQYVKYGVRFLVALVCIGLINGRMGYWAMLSSFFVTLLLSLLCAVLPMGFTALACALLIIAHLYRHSLESCAIAIVLFLCIYLMYYRFSPHDAFVMLLTPVLLAMHIPSVMPFVVGLLFPPVSVLSMIFGVVIWFFLRGAAGGDAGEGVLSVEGAGESLGKIQSIVTAMIGDKTMLVCIAAFTVAAFVIWFVRRLSINRAWMIAIAAGAFVNLIILLIGDLALDADVGVIGAIFGTILGVCVGFLILFFRFNLDYSRVEQVQFEDEEYYYYVKAVPKIVLQERKPLTKSINRAHEGAEEHKTEHKGETKATPHRKREGKDSGMLTKERQHAIKAK
ncbi:MAG: hypothetical protein IJQ12_07860 [Lachnospiraceae bacterium]|nr:hypothetical protein [Lachnospiraceae bacterium]